MTILLSLAFAAVAGLSWQWTADGVQMSYWQMGGCYFASTIAAEVLAWAWEQRRMRRRRSRRAAVVNSWRGRRKAGQP